MKDRLFRFEIEARCGDARAARFTTAHGEIQTPAFMPVGTQGSVKGVDCERLAEAGAQVMLVNTYHLWLRPGPEQVRSLGGIHTFTGWERPILSDSGGFQVFSLRGIRKIAEEGVEFRSHLNGDLMFLSPERSVEIQETLGVDIAMVLDECPAAGLPKEEVERSLALTLRWAERSLAARRGEQTALFGITQGGIYRDLRERSAAGLLEIDERARARGDRGFEGFAVGGVSVGEPKPAMLDVLSYHPRTLPADRPRYVMGVGTPLDLLEGISSGVDLFDCVMPTRAGRFGRAFTGGAEPTLNIRNARHAGSREPLDAECRCLACRRYSRGYLHHLFRTGEMLGPAMLSLHNLTHYLSLIAAARAAIADGTFPALLATERGRA